MAGVLCNVGCVALRVVAVVTFILVNNNVNNNINNYVNSNVNNVLHTNVNNKRKNHFMVISPTALHTLHTAY